MLQSKLKTYGVTKTIKLYWIVKARSKAEAVAIVDDLGEHTAKSAMTVKVSQRR